MARDGKEVFLPITCRTARGRSRTLDKVSRQLYGTAVAVAGKTVERDDPRDADWTDRERAAARGCVDNLSAGGLRDTGSFSVS